MRRHHNGREAEREEYLPMCGGESEGVAGGLRGGRHHAENEGQAEDRQHAVREHRTEQPVDVGLRFVLLRLMRPERRRSVEMLPAPD